MYSEHGTAGEPGAVAGVGGRWRVERGLQGVRSPFSWLGVACGSRHEESMNVVWPPLVILVFMYEFIRFVRDRKIIFKGCLFLRPG